MIIVDPVSGNKFPVHSVKGRRLLNAFIHSYFQQLGGLTDGEKEQQEECQEKDFPHYKKGLSRCYNDDHSHFKFSKTFKTESISFLLI